MSEEKNEKFAFAKNNYMWMIIGLVVVVIGFILMAGGGSDDPKIYNPEVFSPRRITVAPILVLLGFVIEIYAIMQKPRH